MSLLMTAAPAVEPVPLGAVRAHLRIDCADDDAYLASLVATSRLQIEAALGIALVTQSWRWTIDRWPDADALELPLRPVQSITALSVLTASGSPVVVPPTAYRLDGDAYPAVIVADASSLPDPGPARGGIVVEMVAGFGDMAEDVPAPLRHATLLLAAHWYECREAGVASGEGARIPDSVSALLAPYRMVRL